MSQKSAVPLPLWVGLGLFLLVSIPFVLWPFNPHPDERFYSVAASKMIESGNYLVPLDQSGSVRLKKPPVPYYYVVGGFQIFGETLLGAKLFTVLSAAVIIALTYCLSRALGAGRQHALIGAAYVGGHRVFLGTSSQHIPDMPLVLGVTAALWGCVRVFKDPHPPMWAFVLIWFGIAFAVLSKGMLAVILAVLYLVFRLAGVGRPNAPKPSARELIAALLAIGLTLSWYLYVWMLHPAEFAAQFLGDQVTDKAGFNALQILSGVAKTTADLSLGVVPLLAGIAVAVFLVPKPMSDGRVQPARLFDRSALFLVSWCVINLVLFAFSTQLYERYILPASPAFAALVALSSTRITPDALGRGLIWVAWSLLWAPLLVALTSIGFLWKLDFAAFAVVLAIVALALPFALWWAQKRHPFYAGLLATTLFFPMIALALLPLRAMFLLPSPGQLLAERNWPVTDTILILEDHKLIDEIGLQIGGLNRISFRKTLDITPDTTHIVYLEDIHSDAIRQAGYTIETETLLRDLDVTLEDILNGWSAASPRDVFVEKAETLYIASRPDT